MSNDPEYDTALQKARAEMGKKEFNHRHKKYVAYLNRTLTTLRAQERMLISLAKQAGLNAEDQKAMDGVREGIDKHYRIAEDYFWKGYEYLKPGSDQEPDRTFWEKWYIWLKLKWNG